MRYPASEKLEIIRLVEQSQLPVKRTLREARHRQGDLLPLVRPVSERRAGGPRRSLAPAGSGLEPHPGGVRERIKNLALDEPALSPRELAVRFTDEKRIMAVNASRKRACVVSSMRLMASLVCAIESTRSLRCVVRKV